MDPMLVRFFSHRTHLTYPPKTIIIAADPEPAGAYYIQAGHIKMYGLTPDGDIHIHNILNPGCLFPLIWIGTDLPNRYYFESLDDTSVFRADRDAVRHFLHTHPQVTMRLAHRFLTGMDGYLTQVELISSSPAPDRLLHLLQTLAQRFGCPTTSGSTLSLSLTHQEIGQLAGLSRETVTRQLHQLKSQGHLTYTHSTITLKQS